MPGLHIDIDSENPDEGAVASDSTRDQPGFFDRLVNGV